MWMNYVTYECGMSHMNEACHKQLLTRSWPTDMPRARVASTCYHHATCEWVMSRMNESCHTWMSHVTYECWQANDPQTRLELEQHQLQIVTSHTNESCHAWMSHVNESWQADPQTRLELEQHQLETANTILHKTLHQEHAKQQHKSARLKQEWAKQVWHDSILMWCDMTQFLCGTWLVHTCDTTRGCAQVYAPQARVSVLQCVAVCCSVLLVDALKSMRLKHEWAKQVGHDSFACGTWLIRMWDMTHSYVGHDSFTCETWLIHTWDTTRGCAQVYAHEARVG